MTEYKRKNRTCFSLPWPYSPHGHQSRRKSIVTTELSPLYLTHELLAYTTQSHSYLSSVLVNIIQPQLINTQKRWLLQSIVQGNQPLNQVSSSSITSSGSTSLLDGFHPDVLSDLHGRNQILVPKILIVAHRNQTPPTTTSQNGQKYQRYPPRYSP